MTVLILDDRSGNGQSRAFWGGRSSGWPFCFLPQSRFCWTVAACGEKVAERKEKIRRGGLFECQSCHQLDVAPPGGIHLPRSAERGGMPWPLLKSCGLVNKSRLFPIVPLAILLTFLADWADNDGIVG